ncbi:hypothetical protein CgunFtcFv8_023524 [Champsocephalus gunnari]|uniref:Secreted protein n=1 Tax=Champsocephalus gunnari TaxID=52237 RepID=A0AAN8DAI4_CHAGU|nr:hypothetical protein CgunFtcFv8_023524 [Champsocephalus gunnari]
MKPNNGFLLLLLQLGHPPGIARSETSLRHHLILLFSSSTPTAGQQRCLLISNQPGLTAMIREDPLLRLRSEISSTLDG